MTRTRGVLLAAVGVAACAGALVLLLGRYDTLHVTIERGTSDDIDAGSTVTVINDRLSVDRGTTLEVVNRDDRTHIVGPLTIPAGASRRYRFDEVGVFAYPSTVTTGGTVNVSVR
ncbi:MAG TPA: hypothetical protein PKD80_01775 [Microthrixaceae bacterium]|nr:hypothetical protein [Microthrixaceae bacterium]HMT23287.1 hypothetical protein [Microthrixaceae bacterium]HMT60484.1 hypothetical protein [Microthrixaceae bacterium]